MEIRKYKGLLPYIVIGVLAFLLIVQRRDHSNFIKDRDREFKHLSDSIINVNNNLYDQIATRDIQIRVLERVNSEIDNKITSIDNSLEELYNTLDDEINTIDHISIDSNIIILSGFLSEGDDN